MKLPTMHSFFDVILFPIRLIFNLDIGWKATLGLILVLILLGVQFSIFSKDSEAGTNKVAIVNNGWLRTGMIDNNLDSLRVHRGDTLRLLGRQGHLLWAETTDGKYRGFVCDSLVENSAKDIDIPTRRKLSNYFISQKKFESLMSDSASTFGRLEKDFIHAEYIKSHNKKFVGEFGFMVEDSLGNLKRPVITFCADSTVNDYNLHRFRSSSVLLGHPIIDIVSPIISTREFQKFSPLDNNILLWLWIILPGFLLIYIMILLLWARLPLYFVPNAVINLVLGTLVVFGPMTWGVMMEKMVFHSIGIFLITGCSVFVGALLLWIDYSSLRCPKCKHLRAHEFKKMTSGRPFVRHGYTEYKKRHEILEHKVETTVLYKYTDRGDITIPSEYERHFGKIKIYYDVYEYWQTVKVHTKHFECPKCGHGEQKDSVEILNCREKYLRSYSKEEKFDDKVKKGVDYKYRF